ncbi:flagellar protein FlaG [Paenibacillus mesotrionivorans]|uniref:Flagellar protein FlaG n=1 Tax=Paenibacillus mesotrionivorans TaxID=3160968 RepID=A0ACC7P140_9BACL
MSIQPVGNGRPAAQSYASDLKPVASSAPSSPDMLRLARSGEAVRTLEVQGVRVSVGEGQLVKAIDRAIKALEGPTTSFEMRVHEGTHAIMVKVFNKETGELIREIPPEKTLDLVVKMMEFAGILIDEKV